MKAIQLLCLCKTSYIKQYGIDAVLQPFMNDLKKLEQVCILDAHGLIFFTSIFFDKFFFMLRRLSLSIYRNIV